jgi:predicted phosphodiesterase
MNQICIQYLSDIHLEFIDHPIKIDRLLSKIIPIAPICILAGDVGYPFERNYEQFLKGVSKKFKHIILIHGNHEYYQLKKNSEKTMKEIVEKTHEVIYANSLDNIHFLDNEWIDIEDVRFVGTVLWSQLNDPDYLVQDAKAIIEFNIQHFNRLHQVNKEFISNALIEAALDNKSVVMVTHHLPSYQCIDLQYEKYKEYNQCFASDCEELIRSPIIGWIFGHTHSPVDKTINGIQCIANPIGYPGELPKPEYNKYVLFTK